MSTINPGSGKGTLIRGADGGLYFIPDDQMQAFRLPDEKTVGVHAVLGPQNVPAQPSAPTTLTALHGDNLVTAAAAVAGQKPTFTVNLDQLRAPSGG